MCAAIRVRRLKAEATEIGTESAKLRGSKRSRLQILAVELVFAYFDIPDSLMRYEQQRVGEQMKQETRGTENKQAEAMVVKGRKGRAVSE